MNEAMPIVLIPGLGCSARLFAEQLMALWPHGPVTIADTRRGEGMAGIARAILAAAPPRFALAGLSMGGYLAFEIMRQAPERVLRLALLDTSARPDRPDQTERRNAQIAMARNGRFAEIPDLLMPLLLHPDHQRDQRLTGIVKQMHEENGAEAFIRQQEAIKARLDSRPGLGAIDCPCLVLVGDSDAITPPDAAQEMAGGIPAARLVTIERSGHLSTLERPAEVSRALVEWLSR